jgi:hypothetical protein
MSFVGKFLVPALFLLSSLTLSTQSFGYGTTDLSNGGGRLTRVAVFGGYLSAGAIFARGGSFLAEGNSRDVLPGGVLFPGTFLGSSKWMIMDLESGTHNYTLMGEMHGMMGGKSVDEATMVLSINTGTGYFNGSTPVSGDAVVHSASVPEPSIFVLFGTGAFILTGVLRRKALTAR